MARTSGFTRPIPKEDRVIQRRSGQAIAWPVGILVVVAFVVALLILPVRQWVNQRRDVSRAKEELVDDPSAPKKLPKAWPYTMVSNILIVRAEAAKSAAENDDGVLSPLTP